MSRLWMRYGDEDRGRLEGEEGSRLGVSKVLLSEECCEGGE